jgi:hypothetical protein
MDPWSMAAPVGRRGKAPNEKLIETLFTHYALRVLGDTGVTIYTPSTREEYKKGYDAALMGASAFDELFMQFKTPALLECGGYSFGTRPRQHRRLQLYPPNTAYYVTHTFESLVQIQEAQRHAAEDPDAFLRHYLAIEIERLEPDVTRFRYYAPAPDYEPECVSYKLKPERKRTPGNRVACGGWLTGDELLRRFLARALGARVFLLGGKDETNEDTERVLPAGVDMPPLSMSPDKADRMAGKETGTDWGTALRKNFVPLPSDVE